MRPKGEIQVTARSFLEVLADAFQSVIAFFRQMILSLIHWGEVQTYENLVERRVVDDYGEGSSFKRSERERAAHELASHILDPEGWAVFQDELEDLLKEPRVTTYLRDLEHAAREATPERPLRLWDFTVERAGSPKAAVRWLAILLQDTSSKATADDGYLKTLPASLGKEHTQLLATVRAVAATSPESIRAYPDDVQARGAGGLYHYYVPAYIGLRLQEKGVAPGLAMLTAATFNLEYSLARVGALLNRRDDITRELARTLDETTGVDKKALGRGLDALRAQGYSTRGLDAYDIDLVREVPLSEAQRQRFLARVAEANDVPVAMLQSEWQAMTERNEAVSLRALADVVNAESLDELGRHQKRIAMAMELLGPRLEYYRHGIQAPLDIDDEEMRAIYLGFAGAAAFVPEARQSLDRGALETGLESGPWRFMREQFRKAGPRQLPPPK